MWYFREKETPSKVATALKVPYRILINKFFVDEIYFAAFIRPLVKLAEGMWWLDRWIIDGMVNGARHLVVGLSHTALAWDKYVVDGLCVNGTAATCQWASRQNRKIQTGQFQHYALGMLAGFILIVIWYLYL